MIQSNLLSQKKYSTKPNKIYFKILNQIGWECFENATSISLFMVLSTGISECKVTFYPAYKLVVTTCPAL